MDHEENPFASPQSTGTPVAFPPSRGRYGRFVPYESARGRGAVTVGLLSIVILISLLCVGSNYLQIRFFDHVRMGGRPTIGEAQTNDVRQNVVSGLRALGVFATSILFLMWFHRVYRNLPSLGVRFLGFSPASAVGWWFVPFANLIQPFLAMSEIWNGSKPESVANNHAPGRPPSKALIGWWWALYLGMNIILQVATTLSTNPVQGKASLDQLVASTWVFIVGNVVTIVAAAVAIQMILRVVANQDERFRRVTEAAQQSAGERGGTDPAARLAEWLDQQ